MSGDGTHRIKTVDFFKGFAIIAIVMIHIITLHPRESVTEVSSSFVTEFFYTGVITFFLVSGYFYKKRDPGYVINRVLKLLIMIILCIIVGTTILCLYLNLNGYGISVDLYLETLGKQLAGGADLFVTPSKWGATSTSACWIATGYYFLWSFAMTTILFHVIAEWSLKSDRNMAISVTSLVVITLLYFLFIDLTLPFFLQLVPIETAFMLLGAWAGRRKIIHKMEGNWRDPTILIAVAISVIASVVLISVFPPGMNFNASNFGEYGGWSVIPFFFICVFSSVVLIYIAMLLSKIKYLSELVCFIGKFTLQILLLSTFFAKAIVATLGYTLPAHEMMPAMPVGVCVAVGLAAIACCILTTYLVKYIMKAISKKARPKTQRGTVPI